MIKDKTYLTGFNQVKFPKLKGHVKITLHNCRTGKNEVIEGENIITHAVRDIFANNQLGGIDYFKCMPLWSKWFGGVLCYENAFTIPQGQSAPDPDDYFIQGNDVNMCVAHAGGNVIPVDHDDDLLRGSPTSSSRTFTENSVKNVWEWLPSHGNSNRSISAIALTHADTGDAGTGSAYWAFQNFSPFDLIQGDQLAASNLGLLNADNLFARYDDNHGLFFHIGEEGDFYYGRHTSFETKKLTVYVRRLPYLKAGLYESAHADSTFERKFTVTTSGANMYMQPSYFFDISTKYLWIFYNNTSPCGSEAGAYWWQGTWDNNTVNYFVVDCENETIVDEGTIESDTNDLAPLSMARAIAAGASETDFYVNACIIKDGNYVYLPTGTIDGYWTSYSNYRISGYKKINISNQSDQTSITFNSAQSAFLSATKAGGLIINSGRVVNNGVGYNCTQQFTETHRAFQDMSKASFLVMPIGVGNQSGTSARYLAAHKMVNTSKFNLPSPVQKTSNQSMAIEYTLTEVSE